MGLDQWAYARDPKEEYTQEEINNRETNDIPLQTWRKHNRLQGYMEQLWQSQGGEYGDSWEDGFNNKEVKLGIEEIDALEDVIENREMPQTSGFFFGNDSYEEYESADYGDLALDKEFIAEARRYLAKGYEIYYNSSW